MRFCRRKRSYIFVLAFVACLFVSLAFALDRNPVRETAPASSQSPVLLHVTSAETGQEILIDAEVARTNAEFERGLMYRTSLPDNAGMLFLFDQPRDVSFWMKNTFIPLDMLFVRKDGIITKIAARTKTNDLAPIPSQGPVASVLEIKGGEAERLGIKVGDTLR